MECQKRIIFPELMLRQQTFDTCIFQFLSWLLTEYSVDKWHNQYIHGYLVVDKYFRPGSVRYIVC